MMERKLTVAEIMLIAGTRVALGIGIGLVLSTKLNKDQCRAAGWALALVGGLTTIPLALRVIGKSLAMLKELRGYYFDVLPAIGNYGPKLPNCRLHGHMESPHSRD